MRPIAALILAHLAASPLLACASETPSATSPTPTPTPTPTPSPSPSPTPTPTPTPTPSPSPSPSPTASADAGTNPRLGALCKSENDCGAGLKCVLPFNGAHTIPGPGHCRPENEPQMGGRPLYVEGVARVSPPVEDRQWHREDAREALAAAPALEPWRGQLARAAFEEHASVAAFARTICQLVALGAPAWLVDKTQRALADEIVHATRTFEWVERLGGGALGPGPLVEAVAPFVGGAATETLAAELARDVFRGGCVGETLAAHEAAEHAEAAPDFELGAFYTDIANDEARHAALAFETAGWLRSRFAVAAAALDEERARFATSATPEHQRVVNPLLSAVFGPVPVRT